MKAFIVELWSRHINKARRGVCIMGMPFICCDGFAGEDRKQQEIARCEANQKMMMGELTADQQAGSQKMVRLRTFWSGASPFGHWSM
jgi:hypothetical protein